MKIPRTVRIRGRVWKVCFRDMSKTANVGMTCYNIGEIHIAKHVSKRMQREIFAHELLHALMIDSELPYDVEEPIVRSMELNLLSMLYHAGAWR